MNNALLIKFLAIPFLIIFLCDENLITFSDLPFSHYTETLEKDTIIPSKEYRGYRLFISQMKVEKETKDWVRIQFSAINTGRKDIDFSRKGTEHWVQIEFDDSLRGSKMGGFKENIRYSLYETNYGISAGKVRKREILQFPKVFKWENLKKTDTEAEAPETIVISPKREGLSTKSTEEIQRINKNCPDLIIANIKIKDSNKKYTTLQFSLSNIGTAPAKLSRIENGEEKLFGIIAHLSGVDKVTRGAISLGGSYFNPRKGPVSLKPGAILTEEIRLDTRKKTDFLKYIVLSIDAYNIGKECDRTNNFKAIELK